MARDDDFDLNFDDFDDFDFDDGSSKKELNAKSRKPIAKVLAGTKKGLKSGIKDKSLIKKTVLRALPKNVSASIDKADKVKDYAEDLYNKSLKDLDPLITSGADFLEKNLASVKGKLPKVVANRLQKIADTKSSKAKRRSGSKSKSQYENEEILQQLTDIFANQVLGDDKELKADRIEKKTTLKTDKAYKNLSTSLLNGIYESTRTIVKQNDGNTTRYRKAMLEANLRQLYVQKDILQAIQKSHQDQLIALNSIVKNSALPEAVKIQKDEMLSDLMKRRTLGSIADSAQSYTKNYFKNVGKKITSSVRGATGSLGMMGSMMGMGDMGMDNRDIFTKGGEDFVAPMLLDALSGQIGGSIRNRLMKNKKIKGINSKLGYLNDTLPQQLMEWARKPDDDQMTLEEMLNGESLGKKLKRGGKSLAKDYLKGFNKPQSGFRTDSIADLQMPQPSTRKTNKAMEEVIPGYLARILQSVERTRLGTMNVPLIQYDYARNSFSTSKGVTKSVKNLLMDKSKIGGVNSSLDSIVGSLGGENLSPEARTLLKKQLMKDSMEGRRVSAEDYADSKRFSMGGANSKEAQELVKFFESKKGKMSPEEMAIFQKRVGNIGFDSNELRQGVQQLANIGYTEQMANLGIVRQGVNGQNQIDYDAVINRYIPNERGGKNSNPADQLKDDLIKQTEAMVAATQQTNELLNESIIRQEVELGNNGTNSLGIGSRSINERLKSLSNSSSGKKKAMYGRLRNTIGKAIPGKVGGVDVKGIGNNIKNVVGGKIKSGSEQLKDFYIAGRTEPLLKMTDIISGMYIDATTKKTIFSISDIKGMIVDRSGNIIANVNQLVNAETLDGQRIRGIVAEGIESASGMAAMGMEAMKIAAAKLMENNAIDRDLFVPGEINPRLLFIKVQNGEYFSSDGKLIKKYSDTKNGVVQKQGQHIWVTVVSKNEIASKGLVDIDGKQMVRPMSAMIGKLKSGLDTAKRLLGGAKNSIKGLPGNIKGMFSKKGGNLSEEQADNVQVGLLQKLYGLMESRLPQQKGIRKGSYEWLMGNKGGKDRKSARDGRLDKDAKKMGIGTEGDGSLSIGGILMKAVGILTGIWTGIKSLGGMIDIFKKFIPGMDDAGDILDDVTDNLPDGDDKKSKKKRRGRKSKGRRLGKKLGGRGGKRLAGNIAKQAAEKAAVKAAEKAAAKQAGKAGAKLIGKQALKWAGKALLGTAIVGGAILSAPVALAVGVGFALWTAYDIASDVYKYMKDKRAYLTKLRMLQYGVELGDDDSLEKVTKIENGIEKSGGKISGQDLLKQCISIFKIEGDEQKIPYLQTWLVNRFLPVYNAHKTAVTANGGKKVTDADDSVPIEKRMAYVQSIDAACSNIWSYKALPLESDTQNSMIIQKEYQNTLQEAKAYYTEKQKEVPLSTKTVAPASRAGAQLGISAAPGKGVSGSGGGGGTGTTDTKNITSNAKAVKFSLNNVFQMPTTMTALTSIRLKTYGVVDLSDTNIVSKFISMEKAAMKYIALSSNDIVFQCDYGKFLSENLALLGIVENNSDAINSALMWIEKRFIPTLVSYCGLMYASAKVTSDFLESESKLKPTQAVAVATALIGTREYLDAGRSVWSINTSPIAGYKLNSDASSADQHVRFLQSKINEKTKKIESAKLKADEIRIKRTGESTIDDEATGQLGAANRAFKENYQKTVGKTPDGVMDKLRNVTDSISDSVSAGYQSVKSSLGFGDKQFESLPPLKPGEDKVIKGDKKQNVLLMLREMAAAGINNVKEKAMLLSQLDVESGGFTALSENLKYRVDVLMKMFKRARAAGIEAVTAAVKAGPQAIAEIIYGGRKDLGNTEPGDGFKYRGRGFIQLTGRANYIETGNQLGIDLVNNPDLASKPEIAAKIAINYWKKRVGAVGASGDVKAVTYRINGGQNGIEERRKQYAVYLNKVNTGELDKLSQEAGTQVAGTGEAGSGGGGGAGTGPLASSSSSNAAMPGAGPATGSSVPSVDVSGGTGIPLAPEAPAGGAGPLASLGKSAPASSSAAPAATTTPTYNDAPVRSESSAYNTGGSNLDSTNKILTDNQAILNNIATLVKQGVDFVLANSNASANAAVPTKDSATTKPMDTKPVVDMKRSF